MSRWIEALGPVLRFELLMLRGRAALVLTDNSLAPEVRREVAAFLRESAGICREPAIIQEPAPSKPDVAASKTPEERLRSTRDKMSPAIKTRMYELFDEGGSARQVYARLTAEFGVLPFKVGAVSWHKSRTWKPVEEASQPPAT